MDLWNSEIVNRRMVFEAKDTLGKRVIYLGSVVS